MKTAPKKEKKSFGTRVVEKYRPLMNKLTREERQRLLDEGMRIAYGNTPEVPTRHR